MPDALILQIVARVAIAERQRVVLAELIIDARADAQTVLRRFKDAVEGRRRATWARAYVEGVDDGSVINVAVLNIQKEGRLLAQRAAERSAENLLQEWSLLRGIRIARVPDVVAEIEVHVAMKLVGSRLGENLDAAVAELVEFGRKRILVDANLANGILGRQRAAGESVDVDLAAARSGGWAGQGLQIGLQIVGIVGERIQIGAASTSAPAFCEGSALTAGPAFSCTVTSCFSAATRNCRFSAAALPPLESRPWRVGLAPIRARCLYRVLARRQTGDRIAAVVAAVADFTGPAALETVTLAPGTSAPDSSVTTPCSIPAGWA